jgi:hypothetical protein
VCVACLLFMVIVLVCEVIPHCIDLHLFVCLRRKNYSSLLPIFSLGFF